MARDGIETFMLFETEHNTSGDKIFVGRWGDLSLIIRRDRHHVPKPGEDPRWIATVKRSARDGGRTNG